ncbi:MBL fold metallo-hydrolase [Pseudoxanthobacter sp. M-2]|jgi:glyoxylase-like metal-dependent hydrolase (beta-lactamase superfamily II)|uniref:MBL fold metallo-hydrolase n=1 Tax=Pseudoxanthobacter sp. M-2 TaxID=3078754 RepID=UPI0038FC7C98
MPTDSFSTDRRSLILGAGAASAAVVAAATGVFAGARPAFAAAEKQGPMKPNVYRFNLGDFEVVTVQDGTVPMENPAGTFGVNQTPEAVAELATANFLPADKLINGYTPTLVNTGSEVVLFDTGTGAARLPAAGNLAERLTAAGYPPESVDVVVLTHMHGDHIGGLMADGKPVFPNARYVTGATEYDFWSSPDRLSGPTEGGAKLVQANVVPLAEKTTFVKGGDSVVSGITAIEAFGHSPGHMIYNLESGGRRLVLTADTANHYVLSMQRPDWHVRFDMDKDKGVATRKAVLGMIAADKVPFVGFHMPFPSVGYLEPKSEGYRFVPVSYQLDL